MNKTVLIIDDDDILRNALARGLRNEGFCAITAQSAEHADDVLKRISVDAIVLDRMMTGMDGLSFLQKIRKSGNLTPVIMLTAMTGAENTIDGLSSGANDYLLTIPSHLFSVTLKEFLQAWASQSRIILKLLTITTALKRLIFPSITPHVICRILTT